VKAVLINPPLRAFDNIRTPMGLLSLAGSLRELRPGDKVSIIDECVSPGIPLNAENLSVVSGTIVKKALSLESDLVAFTATTADFHHVIHIARELKKNQMDITTVVGGPHATLYPRDYFEVPESIDYVLTGEGEKSFPEFLDALEDQAPLPAKGVLHAVDGEVLGAEAPEIIKDLGALPLPAYELIDMKRYTRPCLNNIRPCLLSSVSLFTSRGCPYDCNFCASPSICGRRVRFFSASRVVDEIELLKNRYDIEAFYFYDEAFTVNKKHLKSICEELLCRKIGLPWGCQTRVDIVDEEIYETMQQAGCIQVDFGVEAGNRKGWRSLRKNINEKQVVNALKNQAYSRCDQYHDSLSRNTDRRKPGWIICPGL